MPKKKKLNLKALEDTINRVERSRLRADWDGVYDRGLLLENGNILATFNDGTYNEVLAAVFNAAPSMIDEIRRLEEENLKLREKLKAKDG